MIHLPHSTISRGSVRPVESGVRCVLGPLFLAYLLHLASGGTSERRIAQRGPRGWPSSNDAEKLSLLEPPSGAYFGVIPPEEGFPSFVSFEARRLGFTPTMYVTFIDFPLEAGDIKILEHHLSQVISVGGIAVITLQPRAGLSLVTRAAAAAFAALLLPYEARGLWCIVSFGHEMNGSWYPWGQQPTAYVAAFRTIASAVKAATSRTAMAWCPNEGGGYPFYGLTLGSKVARNGSRDFEVLDTNRDGMLTMADDMYSPFYPGDDAVDWVGLSVYNWGKATPTSRSNVLPDPHQFYAKITGMYNGTGGDQTEVPNFYDIFCSDRSSGRKPMIIAETSQAYDEGNKDGNCTELDLKQAWWAQVFNTRGNTSTAIDIPSMLPKLKAVVWFDVRKPEAYLQNNTCDWSISLVPNISDAFSSFIQERNQEREHWIMVEQFWALSGY